LWVAGGRTYLTLGVWTALCLLTAQSGEYFENIALFGYECGSGRSVNLSTISLSEVGPCIQPVVTIPEQVRMVQIVQTSSYKEVKVISCGVSIRRNMRHCGMHSHSSHISNVEWVKQLSPKECSLMHETQKIDLYGQTVHNLKMNGTTSSRIVVAGASGSDGSCQNAPQFVDWDGSHGPVVVEVNVQILMYSGEAKLDINAGTLHLRSGVAAPYRDGQANDVFSGQSFWTVGPSESSECPESLFQIAYQGNATEIVSTSPSGGTTETYLVVDEVEVTYAVKLMDELIRCGRKMYTTEHPGVMVVYGNIADEFFLTKKPHTKITADLLSFFQSKLQYLEVRTRTDLQKLHVHSIRKRCELERQTLSNKLATLRSFPEAVGQLLYSAARGVHGVVRGEVLYAVQCPIIAVQYRPTNSCFNAIPVTHRNQSMFLSPITHILVTSAEETPCSRITPNLFQIYPSEWVALTPGFSEVKKEPEVLRPSPDVNLNFRTIRHVANKGLYSIEDMRNLERSMLFPAERAAVNSYVANQMLGNSPQGQFSSLKMFTPGDLEKLADSTVKRIYGWLSEFGVFSSGIIGAICIVQVIKYLLSVGLRVFHLHRELGCGLWLCSAFWSSLANCILHNHIKKSIPKEEQPEELVTVSPTPALPSYEAYNAEFFFPSDKEFQYSKPRSVSEKVCYPSLVSESTTASDSAPTAPTSQSGKPVISVAATQASSNNTAHTLPRSTRRYHMI